MKISNQLTLPIIGSNEHSFANFCVGDNQLLLQSLQQNLADPKQRFFYLWGESATGKSHLLQAACNYYAKQNKTSSNIPLTELHRFNCEILENLEYQDLIVLDDLDIIAGRIDWETAIFNLYNRVKRQTKTILIITAYTAPNNLALKLNDLRSRLNWGEIYQLKPLNDQQKLSALQYYAKERGLDISDEAGQFLIKRINRGMKTLLKKLDVLDEASLQEQRKITIPFIKEILIL